MNDLAQLGSAGALVVLLATVIGYLLNSNRQDRQQHQEANKELRGELKDLETRYELRLAKLDERVKYLETELETERKALAASELRALRLELRIEQAEKK